VELNDVASDILEDAADPVRITIKGSIGPKRFSSRKRIERIGQSARESTIEAFLHSVEEEHIHYSLGRVGFLRTRKLLSL